MSQGTKTAVGYVEKLGSTSDLATAVRIQIMKLSRLLRTMRGSEDGLTATQLSVLGTLQRYGELTMGELATKEHVRPPTMTHTLVRLLEDDLIAKRNSSDDKRRQYIQLTPLGEEVLYRDREVRNRWLAEQVEKLSAEEQLILRQAVPILEKLRQS